MNTERELTEDELNAVSGGDGDFHITKPIDKASSGGDYGGGGGGNASPAINAWNTLLGNYGYK